MLICHCEVVTDKSIRLAVEAGARTVGQVSRSCNAGTCCGGCVPAIVEIIEQKSAFRTLRLVPDSQQSPDLQFAASAAE
jgi:bacterioferritin-associated ferredoxin